jgi:uncharacterized GH25 family protein
MRILRRTSPLASGVIRGILPAMKRFFLLGLLGVLPLSAHDTWVQLNVARAAAGQPVYADLMLGNHGNQHRDFKLDSKIPLAGSTLALISPDGKSADLKESLIDQGSEEKEGYWSTKVVPAGEGIFCVAHTYDAVVTYAPKRALKSAKAFFASGGGAADGAESFSKPLGHPLEIIPLNDPTSLKAGDSLQVKILFKGQPLKDAVVSCIPRGVELAGDFDAAHEARTSATGEAALPLTEANYFLVAVHQKAPEETGETYSAGSEYGATLTVLVGAK